MKYLLILFCVFYVAAPAAETAFPAEIKLTSGTTLHNTRAERFGNDFVVIRHIAGVDTIQYKYIAEPYRTQVLAAKVEAAKSAPNKASSNDRTIEGQVFITTAGAGAYKFAGAQILVYPSSTIDNMKSSLPGRLPRNFRQAHKQTRDEVLNIVWLSLVKDAEPLTSTTTDADGRYSIKVPSSGDFTIFCAVQRSLGQYDEYHRWLVKVVDAGKLDLNSGNADPGITD